MKLESYGISGPPLLLLKNFLRNRSQVVHVNNCHSDPCFINKGVPQGSILGPLLFLIYVNDLPSCLNHSSCILYADDTTILSSHRNLDTLLCNLQTDLFAIQQWCYSNKLSINVKKTVFVPFHSPQKRLSADTNLYINADCIPTSDHVCFLGVLVDSHLKFHYHVNSVCKKISFGIRALLRARTYFDTQTLITMYYAFIHSHFNYCISSWGSTYCKHLWPLQKLQKQALRIITFSPRQSSSAPLFIKLEILPLSSLYFLNIGTLFFKVLRCDLQINIFPPSTISNTNITRFSSCSNFLLPKAKTNYGKQTIQFSCLHFWNTLNQDIKASHSIPLFKKKLKHFLLSSSHQ